MPRMTIDYGIDLGTTNSAIAVVNGVQPEVIRTNEDMDFTPSVVHIDKRGQLLVGRVAYERLYHDPENTRGEFKVNVGANTAYKFIRSGRTLTAEELSAEVLKSLKRDVAQQRGEELQAAVISVPADFDLPENEGTKKAAKLAGLSYTPLVQEPIAAAMAYGFQTQSSKAYWMVFDFGGGTFDAAVIQLRDGLIQVIGHSGDEHLGGKDVDWDIVNRLLVPQILAEHSLDSFHRDNAKWTTAFAKLKREAEKAKIGLSRTQSAQVEIDNLLGDDARAPIVFERDVTRSEVEPILEPYVVRAMAISRQALKQSGLDTKDIEKLILVGGPTKTPYVRERLRDTAEGLGIPLEFSIDPMTVVAQGAAVFAASQRWEPVSTSARPAGTFHLALEFKPIGSERDPLVGGRVTSEESISLEGFEVEITNTTSKKKWRSGRIPLGVEGTFTTSLSADPGVRNIFNVSLSDPSGAQVAVEPSEFPYTIGMTVTDPPLTHDVGVALANDNADWFHEKGTPLPTEPRQHILRTTIDIKKGVPGQEIRIPLIEGTFPKASRNRLIGYLSFLLDRPSRDLPLGSEVEVRIQIDRDRQVHSDAYLPLIDQSKDAVLQLDPPPANPDTLRAGLQEEQARLNATRRQLDEHPNTEAADVLDQIERQDIVGQIGETLQTATPESEGLEKADSRLRELQAMLDEVDMILERPALQAEAKEQIAWARGIVADFGTAQDRRRLAELEEAIQRCIDQEDDDGLRRNIEELGRLGSSIILQRPEFWVGYLNHLRERLPEMTDQARANDLFRRGQRAIQDNDLDAVRAVVRQLMALLPEEQQREVEKAFGSTVIR